MSFWGKIFGTEQAVKNIVDKDNGLLTQVGGWIGNMNYTEEERAEANTRTREWGLKQLEALAPFKVVQRILAFVAAFMWALVGINVLFAIWLGDKEVRDQLLAFAMSDYIFWPVAVVFALYFTGGVFESFHRKSEVAS